MHRLTEIMAYSTNAYTYKPLSAGYHIRILQLYPARDESAPLRCSLTETHISDAKNYKALSYTWGTPIFPRILHVGDDGALRITENLAAALWRLRDYQDSVELWVDAVCIDQGDEEEKSEQIGIMDEIFQRAKTVLVWLGNFGEDSLSLLHDHTRRLSSQAESKSSLEEGGKLGYAIQTILSLPWFQRRWVVQEVVLNANVKFICGGAQVEWTAFGRLVSEVLPLYQGYDVVSSTNREALQSVTKMFELWQHFIHETPSRGECSIVNLLQSFHFLQCYDPKDYLYTICRLAEDIDLDHRKGSHFMKRKRFDDTNYANSDVQYRSEESANTKIRIIVDNRISLQEAFVDFAYQLSNHGLLNWVLSQRLARMKSPSDAWPSWVPVWNYGILRSASLIETVGSNVVPKSGNRLLSYASKTTGLWTARMSHTVLPAYRYIEPSQASVKQNMQNVSVDTLAQSENHNNTSHKRSDDRLPWEIRWRSTVLPDASDNTDQSAWLRTTYQSLVEQFRQMAQSFSIPEESLAAHLETLVLQTLLCTLIEPLQTAKEQIDDIESMDDLFTPVADSTQYAEPFLSLARVIESICRGCCPAKAAMDTALKATAKVLGSQCLFVAEYRSFKNHSPALPSVHIGMASSNIAKSDKILSDGDANFRTDSIQTGFIFRGTEDPSVMDELLLEDEVLRVSRIIESTQRTKSRRSRYRPRDGTLFYSQRKKDISGGIDFFSGLRVSRGISEIGSARPGYFYELVGRCLLVTPDFDPIWSLQTPALKFCEFKVRNSIFYLK
jgi:hypothetical protein